MTGESCTDLFFAGRRAGIELKKETKIRKKKIASFVSAKRLVG